MRAVDERWKQVAIEIGDQVYKTVNTWETVGTADETGYLLMFFNADHHNGRSTLISSTTDKHAIRKLLEYALRNLDGPLASIVEPGKKQ